MTIYTKDVEGRNYVTICKEGKDSYESRYNYRNKIVDNQMMLITGTTGCLSEHTSILTKKNWKGVKLKDLPDNFEVLSYDFQKDVFEYQPAIKIDTGIKYVYGIRTESNKRFNATEEHKFFVKKPDGSIVETEVKNLKEGDSLLMLQKYCDCGKEIESFRNTCSLSCSSKKSSTPIKGKTYEEYYGKKITEKIKSQQRDWTIKNNPMNDKVIREKQIRAVQSKEHRIILSKYSTGENNPAYKHGRAMRERKNRREYIKTAKKYYPWLCMECMIDGDEGKRRYNRDLSVHHIDGNHFNNEPENLAIFCSSCHGVWEQNEI